MSNLSRVQAQLLVQFTCPVSHCGATVTGEAGGFEALAEEEWEFGGITQVVSSAELTVVCPRCGTYHCVDMLSAEG